MPKQFDVSEKVEVEYIAEDGYVGKRHVCPDCKDHPQVETPTILNGCANLFMKKGVYGSRGQCGCHSDIHNELNVNK